MLAEELPGRHVPARPQHPGVAVLARAAQPRGRRVRPRVLDHSDAPPSYCPLAGADWGGASLPRRGDRAAHPQAGRGRPHHHPADPSARAGARGGEGGAPDHVEVRLPARAVHPRRRSSWPRGATSTRSPRPRPTTPFAAPLGADYERYTAGTVMLETAERLVTEEKQPSTQQFLLLVGGLRAMVGGERRPSQVLDSYLLRSLAVAGYAPSFDHCARCGLEGPHRWFNPSLRRDALHHLPGPRLGRPRAPRPSPCSVRCSPVTGRSSRPPTRATSRRPAAWSRRSSPGTSSAGCARWPTSSAEPRAPYRPPADPAPLGSPAARAARRTWSRGTSRS